MLEQVMLSFSDFIHFSADDIYLAVTFKEDIMGSIQQAWNSFVQSGQLWALMIGAVVGYLFRSITSY